MHVHLSVIQREPGRSALLRSRFCFAGAALTLYLLARIAVDFKSLFVQSPVGSLSVFSAAQIQTSEV